MNLCVYVCIKFVGVQDFLNMFFREIYRPIPWDYNLVLAMLWRHPENNVDLERVKVVHYCAEVSGGDVDTYIYIYIYI